MVSVQQQNETLKASLLAVASYWRNNADKIPAPLKKVFAQKGIDLQTDIITYFFDESLDGIPTVGGILMTYDCRVINFDIDYNDETSEIETLFWQDITDTVSFNIHNKGTGKGRGHLMKEILFELNKNIYLDSEVCTRYFHKSFADIDVLSSIDDYAFMVKDCFYNHIHTIYLWAENGAYHEGIYDVEMNKIRFIKILEKFILEERAKLVFVPEIVGDEKKQQLDHADIQTQLVFFYHAFPIEYDKDVMEKDIDNLWWYCCCPAVIAWPLEDGGYWISD